MRTLAIVTLMALSAIGFMLGGYFLYDWVWGTGYQLRAAEQALAQRDFLAAETHIARCLEAQPNKPEMQFLAARIKRRSIFPILPGGADGPGACLTAGSVRYDGSYDDVLHHLALYAKLGGLTELLNLEQNLLRAQSGEGTLIVQTGGDLMTVEQVLQTWVQDDHPDTPLILEALIKGYLQSYRLADALKCLKVWLKRQDDIQARLWRAWILERLGDSAGGLKEYQQVLAQNPEHNKVRQRVAEILLRLSGPAEAVKQFELLRQRQVSNPALLVGLAQCRKALGAPEEAQQLLDALLAEHAEYVPGLIERGKLALDKQQEEEAEHFFRDAVRLAPHDALATYNLYLCLLRRGKKEEARDLAAKRAQIEKDMSRMDQLSREVAISPHEASLRYEAGTILLRNGLKEDGRRWLLSALREDPAHGPTHAALAELYEKEGNGPLAAFHRRLATPRRFVEPDGSANRQLIPRIRIGP
jgi:tetratricopeptide (TPR) repeat protein